MDDVMEFFAKLEGMPEAEREDAIEAWLAEYEGEDKELVAEALDEFVVSLEEYDTTAQDRA